MCFRLGAPSVLKSGRSKRGGSGNSRVFQDGFVPPNTYTGRGGKSGSAYALPCTQQMGALVHKYILT